MRCTRILVRQRNINYGRCQGLLIGNCLFPVDVHMFSLLASILRPSAATTAGRSSATTLARPPPRRALSPWPSPWGCLVARWPSRCAPHARVLARASAPGPTGRGLSADGTAIRSGPGRNDRVATARRRVRSTTRKPCSGSVAPRPDLRSASAHTSRGHLSRG